MRRTAGAVHRLVLPMLAVAAASAIWMAVLFGATRRRQPRLLRHRHEDVGPADRRRRWPCAGGRGGRGRPGSATWSSWTSPAPPPSSASSSPCCRWGSDTTFLYRGGFVVVALLSIVVVAAAVHPGARLLGGLLSVPAPAVDRAALLRHLPVALARGRPPQRARRGLAEAGDGAPLDRPHARPGRAELPVRGVADPPRRAHPLVPPAAHGRRARALGAVEPGPAGRPGRSSS